jgi:hypothetical protein
VNVRTVSYELTIGTYTFNMKGLKYYKLIHQIKKKTLKVPNFHIQVMTFRSEMVLLSMYIGSTSINRVP